MRHLIALFVAFALVLPVLGAAPKGVTAGMARVAGGVYVPLYKGPRGEEQIRVNTF